MKAPSPTIDEAARILELKAYRVLDSSREPAFDRLTQLAARMFDVPIATVSLVDTARQWFKSAVGLSSRETSRDVSFCGHAIHDAGTMVVKDAKEDDRFADNPLVLGAPNIRFYAGAPLTTPRGYRVGTLCVIDNKPRELTPLQQQVLQDLAALVVDQLELRRARFEKETEAKALNDLFTSFPVPVIIGTGGIVQFANHEAEKVLEYPAGALTGKPMLSFIHPEERAHAGARMQSLVEGEVAQGRADRKFISGNGALLRLQVTSVRMMWQGQQSIVAALRDVSAERTLQEQRERQALEVAKELQTLQVVFEQLPEGIALFDTDWKCAFANKAMGDMFGLDPKQILGWTPDDAAQHVASLSDEPTTVMRRMASMRDVTDKQGLAAGVFHVQRPRPRVLRRTLLELGLPTRPYVVVWSDISREAAALEATKREASTDPLTGVLNRRGGEGALNAAHAAGGPVAVALFDVDHFKKVNDTFGHGAGDVVLKLVGGALQKAVRGGDVVARWGGEEFIAILRTDLDGARVFAERARAAISALETPAGKITISVGVSTEGVDAADEKLYEAKRSGRNRVCG